MFQQLTQITTNSMKQTVFEIVTNRPLTESVYEMTLKGDTSAITRPGQFVELSLEGYFLRRPISVCNYNEGTLTLIYKVVGKGTAQMATLAAGTKIDTLTGLGNGFDTSVEHNHALLVGGGVGVPPLYRLARNLVAEGKKESQILEAEAEKQAAILRAEAEKEARIKKAEAEAEAILKINKAQAESIRLINEAKPDEAYLLLKKLETYEKAADGQATKIIVPSDLQGVVGLVNAITESTKK